MVRGSYGVGLWKAIRKEWERLSNGVVFSVGSGQRVKFWKGKWCGDVALCTSYPALYSIVYSKEDWVVNVWHSTIEGGCWATSFIRAINDWELDLVERFLLSLHGRTVCRDQEDKVI